MATKPLPTIQQLRQLLRYDPETGMLFWKERPASMFQGRRSSPEAMAVWWNDRYAGTPALNHTERSGYLNGAIWGGQYKAHRVAWAIFHGSEPAGYIDHINGDRSDNRIVNLRIVDKAANGRNSCKMKNNSSGYVGVSEIRGKWQASCSISGKQVYVGVFPTPESAAKARDNFYRKNAPFGSLYNFPLAGELPVRD